MSINRTGKTLTFRDYQNYLDTNLQTKALRRAYLGDELGIIEVQANGIANEHYGKVYIRFPVDTDDNGATVLGQAVEAYVNPNCNFTHKNNLPVLVRTIGSNSGYMVEQIDAIAANRVGYNTHVLNPMSPANNQIWLRQVRDGRIFAPATINSPSTSVSIEPFLYYFDGTLYDGSEAQSIDLSSYIPGTLTERLVVVGKRANDNTVQIVQSSTRAITSDKYALDDINALVDDFDDYVMPIQAVKLGGDTTTVEETNLHQDLRQFQNVQQPRGFPLSITKHRLVLSGWQEFFYDTSEDGGILQVDGLLVEVA